MLPRRAKAAFYAAASPAMAVNGWLHRHFRAPASGVVKVHLGPGQKNYLPGWINVDANMFTARCDIWADLRSQLPFRDATVDAAYSHHVIEHLPDLRFHLSEVYRCLKPGGVYRVGGPHGDMALRKFMDNDTNWFGDFPDARRSIGGRFENFVFCRQEHLTILTESFLQELLTDAGFAEIAVRRPTNDTKYPDFFDAAVLGTEWESDMEFPHTLILEAAKPR